MSDGIAHSVQPEEHLGATVIPQFVTSSLSVNNGACVEVAAVPIPVKSSLSPDHGLNCVEADVTSENCVLVMDSKDRTILPLHCDIDLWGLLVQHIKAGQYAYDRLVLEPPTTSCCRKHGIISIVLQLDGTVRMRHSLQKKHKGLFFTPDEWWAFIGNADGPKKGGAKDGEFDLVLQDGHYHIQRKLTLAAATAA